MTINISESPISIIRLWREGHKILAQEGLAAEQAKIGTLRGGSVGVLLEDGQTVLGKCHRLAHLRSLGLQEAFTAEKYLMFGAGFDNENEWLKTLRASWKGEIKCEEEVLIKWTTSEGYVVTGRPDMVLFHEGIPILGVEHKLVGSVWTANSVHYKLEPKTPHLIQAAHYMWKLNLPYKLLYTSYVDWHVPYNLIKLANKHDVEMRDGKPLKILQFNREYDLKLEYGRLYYITKGMSEWRSTLITVEGIERYYNTVGNLSNTKNLGPRPSNKTAINTKSYNPCDYCPLTDVCDAYEDNYELWLDKAALTFNKDSN